MDNTNLNQQPVQEITKKKKWLLPVILGVAALLVIGLGVGGFIYIKSVALPKKEVQRNLDLGDKYLTDMDYEKAVLSYKEAITIDPKNVKAYVGLGDAYLAWADELVEEGNTEEAIKKLKKGIKELKPGINETGSDEVKEKKEELEEKKKELDNPKQESSESSEEDTEEELNDELLLDADAYNAYLKYLTNLNDTLGTRYIKSVSFCDIAGNDSPEMMVFIKEDLSDVMSWYSIYLYILTYKDGSVVEISSDLYNCAHHSANGTEINTLFVCDGEKGIYSIFDTTFQGTSFGEYKEVFFYYEENGAMKKKQLMTYADDYSDDRNNYYSVNGSGCSKDEYIKNKDELIQKITNIVYLCDEWPWVGEDPNGVYELGKNKLQMSYDDAVEYLNAKLL